MPRLSGLSAKERRAELARFATAVGSVGAVAADAGDAVVAVAEPSSAARRELAELGVLLEGIIGRLDERATARARDERLDLGLALTAHEIRGPLLGVRAALDQVLDGAAVEDRRPLLSRARDEVDRLAELVDPLLRWATGEGRIVRRRFDLVALIRDTCDAEERAVGTARITLLSPARAMISGDRRHLRNAFANVVRNALTYSPTGSKVRVEVAEGKTEDIVRIRDRGPGIPVADRDWIFDPFVRGGSALRTRGGTGLGLFVARRVVDAHGGSIAIEPGRRGATFVIKLPRVSARRG